jgi:heme/copper-type cytochrome/quinol oxidase subunit 2
MLVISRARSLLVAGFAAATFMCVSPVIASAAHAPVDVVVKNWSFTPSTIEAHVGEPVLLRFTDSEGVHGVEAADIGLVKTMITPGKVTEVTFTPKTTGTFAVHCAVVCGEGHDKMVLTAHVSP